MVKALQRLVLLYSIIKMNGKKNNPVMGFLFLVILSVFLMPYISSCGKGGQASSIASNTQFKIQRHLVILILQAIFFRRTWTHHYR
jgi:hypothetical protein